MLSQVYEQMEPPAEMLMSLLPFQKEFLAWAVSQERGEVRGGILADEMGMGKTIQARSSSVVSSDRSIDLGCCIVRAGSCLQHAFLGPGLIYFCLLSLSFCGDRQPLKHPAAWTVPG